MVSTIVASELLVCGKNLVELACKLSDVMSDPDAFARSIVQQYLFEHGMHSGKWLITPSRS